VTTEDAKEFLLPRLKFICTLFNFAIRLLKNNELKQAPHFNYSSNIKIYYEQA